MGVQEGDVVLDLDAWTGRMLILGYAQLRLLDTSLLQHLAALFRIPDWQGKSRRGVERALLDHYQSKMGHRNAECINDEIAFDIPRQVKRTNAHVEGKQEGNDTGRVEWKPEEDQVLRGSVPRLFSEYQELTHKVTAWTTSFLAQNPSWNVDAPRASDDTLGMQVWKVVSEELGQAFRGEEWFRSKLRTEKHVKQRWGVLGRSRLQERLEEMTKRPLNSNK